MPEIRQRPVGSARHDPGDLGVGDALDIRQAQPDAIAACIGPRLRRRPRRAVQDARWWLIEHTDSLDAVFGVGTVDVEPEHRDTELPGVVEDQPLRVHAGVMGEHTGQERSGMVRLEPRRLIGRHGERCRVRLAESERGEGLEHLPYPFDGVDVVAPPQRCRHEPRLHLRLPLRVAQRTACLVRLGEGAAGHRGDDVQHLLMEDHHTAGLLQRRNQIRMQVVR